MTATPTPTPSETQQQACEVPLVEQLRSVPKDYREMREVGYCAHRNIPYGTMLHKAADRIVELERELTAEQQRAEQAEAELGKLQALHGCCQEMVVHWCEHAVKRGDAAEARVAALLALLRGGIHWDGDRYSWTIRGSKAGNLPESVETAIESALAPQPLSNPSNENI